MTAEAPKNDRDGNGKATGHDSGKKRQDIERKNHGAEVACTGRCSESFGVSLKVKRKHDKVYAGKDAESKNGQK